MHNALGKVSQSIRHTDWVDVAQSSDPDHVRPVTSRHDRRAFTLMELLVVIAIIATLAAIVAPSIFRNLGDAKTSAAQSQIEILSLALNSYRLDNGDYPSQSQGLIALRVAPTGTDAPPNWRGPYLTRDIPLDPWRRPYVYTFPGVENQGGFDLYTLGKDGKPGGDDEDADVTSWGGKVHQ